MLDVADRARACDWDRVVAVAGDLLVEEDIYPVRYRVTGFPTDDQLEKIGEAEL